MSVPIPTDQWIMLGSSLGFSVHCRCGWVSQRMELEDAYVTFVQHWESAHIDGRGDG